jgi:transposase-like protein
VPKQPQRAFTTEFKVLIVQRIESGERFSAVSGEMGIRRKLLYEWRAAYRALGAAGLNRKRGPKRGVERVSVSPRGHASTDAPPSSGVASSSARPRGEMAEADALSLAQARIAELERVIGRQQADLHFFREALRLWDATSPNDGAPISTKSSKK